MTWLARAAGIVLIVGLAGCGQASAPQAASSGHSPISSESAVTSSCRAQAPATPRGQIAVEVAHSNGTPPMEYEAGWVNAPAGTFTPDPSADRKIGPAGAIAWDALLQRWLPTYPASVSPDEAAYVPPIDTDIKVVDARSGAFLHDVPAGPFNSVVGYTKSSVYLQPYGQFGLGRLDLASGEVTTLSTAAYSWEAVDDAGAWGTANDDALYRLDFSTREITKLYPGSNGNGTVTVLGFAESGVLVVDSSYVTGEINPVLVGTDGSLRNIDTPGSLISSHPESFEESGSTIPTILATFRSNYSPGRIFLAAFAIDYGFVVAATLKVSPTASGARSAGSIYDSDLVKVVGPCVAG